MRLYCPKCGKQTKHRKLKKSFIADLVIAVITKFSMNLTSPDYECKECGHQHD